MKREHLIIDTEAEGLPVIGCYDADFYYSDNDLIIPDNYHVVEIKNNPNQVRIYVARD